MQSPSPERIRFAHTLRGLACLIVVFYHLILLLGTESQIAIGLTGLNHTPRKSNWLADFAAVTPINFGCLGVGLFFLISGMVIPLSIAKTDRTSFLIARFFRLVPTYACCLAVTILGLWAAHVWFGQAYDIPWQRAVAHVVLVRDLCCYEPIDGVVWTLEVEAKFYLLCLLLAPLLRGADVRGLLMWNVVITALMIWAGVVPLEYAALNLRWFAALRSFQLSLVSMCFMWTGAVLCFHHQGRCSTLQAIVAVVLLDAMFVVQCLCTGVYGPWPVQIMLSYQAALVLFLAAYLAPQFVMRFRWLDSLADISYPLYALHGALGYATALLINAATGQLYLSMAGSILAMIVLAVVMHRLVELPTQACGKWLAKKWLAWKASLAPPEIEPAPLVLREAA